MRSQRLTLASIVSFVALNTLLGVLGPFLMGKAIDVFTRQRDLTELARILIMMILVYLALSGGTWLQEYLAAGMAQRVVRNIRKDLFVTLHALSLRFFDRRASGEIMSRLTNDTENISGMLSMSVTGFIRGIMSIIGVAAMMFIINERMAAVVLCTLPMAALATRWLSHHTRHGFRAQQSNLGNLNALVEETVSGQRVVKAYGHEAITIQAFDKANCRLQQASTRAQIYAGFAGPLINVANNIGWTVVVVAGGWMALQGTLTIGMIAAFISYTEQFTRPLNQLAQLYTGIQSALAGAERVFELMRETPDLTDAPNALSPVRIKGEVMFKDVWFGYEPDRPVIKKINMRVTPGELVALVGPTGAGKTTIANLLARFYDVKQGAIYVDGMDIRDVKRDELRRKLALVLQDNFLFADTVLANICYGNLKANYEEAIEAARTANADQFIRRLPQGYDTILTERGSNLSHGQRQLIAIARAILTNPDILILDEATSNVDTRTEKHLREALLRLMHGRTSFVIAHRLSTIRNANQVLVIKNGEIVEQGTHESLLKTGGYYLQMVKRQQHALTNTALVSRN